MKTQYLPQAKINVFEFFFSLRIKPDKKFFVTFLVVFALFFANSTTVFVEYCSLYYHI